MLSVCGRGGGAVAAGEEQRAPYPRSQQQLGAAIDAQILNQLQGSDRS